MVERRDHIRFDSDLKIKFSTVEFLSNVKSDAYLMDCSRIGAKVVSPVYHEVGQGVKIEIETMKGGLEVFGKIIESKEDPNQKYRFERTFVVHVQFEPLSDELWNNLISLAKRL